MINFPMKDRTVGPLAATATNGGGRCCHHRLSRRFEFTEHNVFLQRISLSRALMKRAQKLSDHHLRRPPQTRPYLDRCVVNVHDDLLIKFSHVPTAALWLSRVVRPSDWWSGIERDWPRFLLRCGAVRHLRFPHLTISLQFVIYSLMRNKQTERNDVDLYTQQ